MSRDTNDHGALVTFWQEVERHGGPEAYILSELKRAGVPVRKRVNITRIKDDKLRAAYIADRKREEDARGPLRRKVWDAYRATHLVHLGLDIYWNDVVGVDFFDPYQRQQRLADSALPELETVDQLIGCLREAVPELDVPTLRWFCYHREVARSLHYRPFTIPKKTGGVRHIWAPLPRLKAMQRWILDNVAERLPRHGAAHGFVVGRSIVTNARVHTGAQVLVNVDLKDFFPTFTFPRVKGIFRSAGYLEGISTLLALLCTEAPRLPLTVDGEQLFVASGPRCLPQGSPASPALTNAACLRLDRRLAGYAARGGWRYTRYADDLTFSLPTGSDYGPRVRALLAAIHEITAAEGLTVHPDKTSVRRPGQRMEVTGLVVNGEGEPRVPRAFRRRLRAALHTLEQGRALPEHESPARLLGNAAFLYSADPEEGRRQLEALRALIGPL
jgi:RNA-directed DNA polymerase